MISNIIPSVSRDIPSVILVAGLQGPEAWPGDQYSSNPQTAAEQCSSDCKDDGIAVVAAIVTVNTQSPTQHLATERSGEGRMSHSDDELYKKDYFLAPDSVSGTQLKPLAAGSAMM